MPGSDGHRAPGTLIHCSGDSKLESIHQQLGRFLLVKQTPCDPTTPTPSSESVDLRSSQNDYKLKGSRIPFKSGMNKQIASTRQWHLLISEKRQYCYKSQHALGSAVVTPLVKASFVEGRSHRF